MAILLVTYDVHDPNVKAKVLEYLDKLHAHKTVESSYLVETDRGASTIVTDLRQLTKDKITVYVVTLSSWAGYGPDETNMRFVELLN